MQARCLYCHEDHDGWWAHIPRDGEGNFHIQKHHPIHGGWLLHFSGKYKVSARMKINYCPMCGRELKEDEP